MRIIDPDFPTARARFLEASERLGLEPTTFPHPLPGRSGESLDTDVVVLGDPSADHVVFLVSGTHGVEGYAGSMLQTAWLEDKALLPSSVRVVVVHAINPHGFSFDRRVTEDNVDLNRNFVDWSCPPQNPEYDAIASVIVPSEWTQKAQETSMTELIDIVEDIGLEATQAAISRGQYSHPRGVFYGGTRPTWSHRTLRRIVETNASAAASVTVVDLHTGLGPWGVGELISASMPDAAAYKRAEARWGSVMSAADGSSVSAQVTGDWFSQVETWVPQAKVTPVALEFGTVDTMQVIQALRADAWRSGASTVGAAQDEEIRLQLRAAFLDEDPAWAAALWTRFLEVFDAAINPPDSATAVNLADEQTPVSS